MSLPAMPLPASRFQRRRCAPPKEADVARSAPLFDRARRGRRSSWRRRGDSALAWHRECRPRIPHGRGRRCGALWLVAIAGRQRRGIALLQFLLHAADLYVHDRRSNQRRGVLFLHCHGGHRLQCGCARAHAGGRGDGAGAQHRVALRIQPKARGHRHARRRALGHGLSDCVDAQGSRCIAAARERLDCRKDRLSSRGHARRGGFGGREVGVGERPSRRVAARIRSRAQSVSSCRCTPAAAPSGLSASTATSRARF